MLGRLRTLFSQRRASRPDLHSFPTRRSSDLIRRGSAKKKIPAQGLRNGIVACHGRGQPQIHPLAVPAKLERDRKSTRLNSSHVAISYAVFSLKKKNN